MLLYVKMMDAFSWLERTICRSNGLRRQSESGEQAAADGVANLSLREGDLSGPGLWPSLDVKMKTDDGSATSTAMISASFIASALALADDVTQRFCDLVACLFVRP